MGGSLDGNDRTRYREKQRGEKGASVARMERSEMRERSPGLRFAPSGLRATHKKAAAEIIRGGLAKSIIVRRVKLLSLAGLAATYSSKS
jgi:hypothetical protein